MHWSEYSMSSQLRSTSAVGRVMKSVLSITKDLVIRQVTLKNPAEAKNFDELVRVVSIIQLWFIWHSRVASSSKQSDKEDPVASSHSMIVRTWCGYRCRTAPSTKLTKCGSNRGLGGKLGGVA